MHWQFVLLFMTVVCAYASGEKVAVGSSQQQQLRQQGQRQKAESWQVDRSKPRTVFLSPDDPRILRQKEIIKQKQQQIEEERRQLRQPDNDKLHQYQQQQQSGPIRQPAGQRRQKDGVIPGHHNYDQTREDLANWTEACGANKPQVLDKFDGQFTSPYYPQPYPPDMNCQWRILSQFDNSQGIFLEFRELHLHWEDCVTISQSYSYDGWYDYKSCGYDFTCWPPIITKSYSSDANFTFTSLSSTSGYYPGFNVLYSSETACYYSRNLAPALSGSFWSLYLPWETSAYSSCCVWYYSNYDGYDVEMVVTFEHFNLSQSCDYYDSYGYLEICDNYVCLTYYCDPGTLYLYGSYISFHHHMYYSSLPGVGFNLTFEIGGNSTNVIRSTTTTPSWWTTTPPWWTDYDSSTTTTSSPDTTTTTRTTTTTTTASQLSTTQSPAAPNIFPEPYVTMLLNGTMTASYAIDSSCSKSFSSEFRNSYNSMISRSNDAIDAGQLCVGAGGIDAAAGAVQFNFIGTEAKVTFAVLVGLQTSESTTIRQTEVCSYDVSAYVQSFSNWPQPIIGNVYGCPVITFTGTQFDLKSADWSCS